jgi:ABC-type Fe3+/spermidine/putrescine transport system ATPase subunit
VKLLIADEIISMLDASTRVDVLNMLVDLKRRGLGILFITHDLSLGNYISDKTVILRNGVVLEMGLTPKVFGNPQHAYTKSLLTAVPQLHKKWQPVNGKVLAGARPTNGSAAPASSVTGPPAGYEAEPAQSAISSGRGDTSVEKRFSKSRVSGAGGARDVPDERTAARPSLMDMSDTPWGRRGPRPNTVRAEALLLDQAPPELVECEEGHFVALSDDHQ